MGKEVIMMLLGFIPAAGCEIKQGWKQFLVDER